MKNLGAEYENLDQKAYLIIKEMITNRKLLPGDKIPQENLAQELGISRTPNHFKSCHLRAVAP